jgi:hypothetical protein
VTGESRTALQHTVARDDRITAVVCLYVLPTCQIKMKGAAGSTGPLGILSLYWFWITRLGR